MVSGDEPWGTTPSFVFAQDEAGSVSWGPDLMVSEDEPCRTTPALWFVSVHHEGCWGSRLSLC